MSEVTRIRYVSDLHLEFAPLHLPVEEPGKEILVIAGDLAEVRNSNDILAFFLHHSPLFKWIYWLMGNHEYYGGDWNTTFAKAKDLTGEIDNLSVVEKVKVDNLLFTSLWSAMNSKSMALAGQMMNDYRLITNDKDLLVPVDTVAEHLKCVKWLEDNIEVGDVVFTHHAPSFKSQNNSRYEGGELEQAYCSDLEWLIRRAKPSVWVHGHTHLPVDYRVEETRVVSNPRGYARFEAVDFNPEAVLEV